jgi:ATP-dependent Clp protease, protease subunit
MKRSDKDFVDQFYDHGIYVPTRTIDIMHEEVTAELAAKVIKALHVLDHSSQAEGKPITILLNSLGGDQGSGMAIYDAIIECKNHVTIKAYGAVMSIAVWILQAADHRVMSKNSRMMLHTGQMGLEMNHPEINKRWMEQHEKDELIFEDIILKKIQVKQPKYTKRQVKELLKFDTILTPEQALDLNLIDEIT